MINFSSFLFNSFILLTVAFIYLFFIKPLGGLSYYKKLGQPTYFFPIVGFLKKRFEEFRLTGDFRTSDRVWIENNPNKLLYATNIGKNVALFLCEIEIIKDFFQKQQYYQKAEINKVVELFMGQGLLLAEGDRWKRNRRIISSFFNYNFMKDNVPLIQEITQDFMKKFSKEELKNFDIMEGIQEITGEIVAQLFFGKKLSHVQFRGKSIALAAASLLQRYCILARGPLPFMLGKNIFRIPFPTKFYALQQEAQEFRAVIRAFIKERKNQMDNGNDLLAGLLQTQERNNPDQAYSDEDIIDEYITFVVAGTDTTGHLVAMLLYHLTQHPNYIDLLKQEREKGYDKEDPVSMDTLQSMDVLHSFIKETLRFHTPAPGVLFRQATEDHKLLDVEVKKGTIVNFNMFSNPFNQEYVKDPLVFNPERWMDPNFKLPSFAFLPFSSGARNCIGQHLATVEAKIITSEFLKKFDFKLIEGYKLRMTMGFMYEPKDTLRLDLAVRN